MDGSGLESVTCFVINNRMKILTLGEYHSGYNPYKVNSMHNYINKQMVSDEKSYILVEDLYFNRDNDVKGVAPRLFNPKRIVSVDDIREGFTMLGDLFTNGTYKKAMTFMNTYPRESPILKPEEPINPIIDQYNFGHKSVCRSFGVTNFIRASYDVRNMYNLADETRKDEFGDLIILSDIAANSRIGMAYMNENLANDIMTYNMSMYGYVCNTFMYRIVNWIVKELSKTEEKNPNSKAEEQVNSKAESSSTPLNKDQIWRDVYGFIKDAINKVRQRSPKYDSICKAVNLMLDFVAILKLLDIYDSVDTPLVWISAGDNHAMVIKDFITNLFTYVKATITVSDIDKINNTYDISTLHEFGLQPIPVLTDEQVAVLQEVDAGSSLEVLKQYLTDSCNIKHSEVAAIIDHIMTHQMDAADLCKLVSIIVERDVFRPYLKKELMNIFVYTRNIPVYLYRYHYGFSDIISHIFLPAWSEHAVKDIETYEITDLINDPKSAVFSELRSNVNILTVPENKSIPSKPFYQYKDKNEINDIYYDELSGEYDDSREEYGYSNYDKYDSYTDTYDKRIVDYGIKANEEEMEIAKLKLARKAECAIVYRQKNYDSGVFPAIFEKYEKLEAAVREKYKNNVNSESEYSISGGYDKYQSFLNIFLLAILILLVIYFLYVICCKPHRRIYKKMNN